MSATGAWAALAALTALNLQGCMSRFAHESYDCSSQPLPFISIDLRNPAKGSTAEITAQTASYPATITQIDAVTLTMTTPTAAITINRETGQIVWKQGDTAVVGQCVKSEFKM
jgi:hypothetical protein